MLGLLTSSLAFLGYQPLTIAHPNKNIATGQSSAVEDNVKLGWRAFGKRIGSAVPNDDLTSSVLAFRDFSLKIDIIQLVIFYRDGKSFYSRLFGNSLWHSPAF